MAAVKSNTHEYLMKLLMVGDSGVGKSCLLLRFCDDTFTPSFISTIGIDFKVRTVEVDGKKIKLQVWDTAGQERFRTITTAYYRGAMGIMLAYDITDPKSFENLQNWVEQIKQHAAPDVNFMIVGNKTDLAEERKVDKKEGESFAKRLGVPFMEASAKSGDKVEDAFLKLVKEVKRRLIDKGPDAQSLGLGPVGSAGNVKLDNIQIDTSDWKSKCCG